MHAFCGAMARGPAAATRARAIALALTFALAFASALWGRGVHAGVPQSAGGAGVPSGSAAASAFIRAIAASGDSQGKPWAVVDKRSARLWLFDAQGRLKGESPVLVGETAGDHTAPDVGAHAQQGHVPLAERTTPAGRFTAEAGPNASGERVVWLDWDAAFALHRLRPGRSERDRAARLASGDPSARRASWGCVVVPGAFFDGAVQSWLAGGRAIVYVMPEASDAMALLAP